MSDTMFDEEMAEYVDEEEVRRLLSDLGYKNPSREAIEQTIAETRKVFRQQRALVDQSDDAIDDDASNSAARDPAAQYPPPPNRGQPPHAASRADVGANHRPEGLDGDDEYLYNDDHNDSEVRVEWRGTTLHQQHLPPTERLPHFLAAEKMDEGDLGGAFPPQQYRYLGNPSPGEEAVSAAGRTTSTPAHAVGRTPTSNHPKPGASNSRKAAAASKTRQDLHHQDITIPSSVSSRPSSAAPVRRDPYHSRPNDPQHLQHYAPYVQMMEKSTEGHQPYIPRHAPYRAGATEPQPSARAQSAKPELKSRPRPSTASITKSNVIYAFTGDRSYRPRILTTGGAQARPVAKHTDPVKRGAQMRNLWQKDDFLTQRGRNEERWEVRRSMLSWEGQ